MGTFDFLLSREQRLIKERRRVDSENREIQADINLAKSENHQRELIKERDDLRSAKQA
jgi:hypothetical protein